MQTLPNASVISRPFYLNSGICRLLIFFVFSSFPLMQGYAGSLGPLKKTYFLIRKGELAEARNLLEKAQQNGKDDYGMDYVFSLYYLSPYQKTLSLDSSYFYCLKAIDKYKKENTTGKRRYEKLKIEYLNIDSAELFSRKDYLDSLGFNKAQSLESESAYQWFLDHFPQSTWENQAKKRRASLAFERAKEENSYQAFEKFLEKYPDAGEAAEAREIRELMIFQNAMKKGRLADLEEFIQNQPNNRYILKAQEKVYEISTARHTAATFFAFIQKYPGNPNVRRAWDWIYYLESGSMNLRSMLEKYPGLPVSSFEDQEVLSQIQLIPFTERGKFGWMNQDGHTIIQPRFDSIPEDARCEPGNIRFVKAFSKHKVSVFCLDSFPSTAGEFDNAEWFDDGIIKVFRAGKQGLYHISGYPLLEPRYDNIVRISQSILEVEFASKKHLFTIKGSSIELPGADEITPAGGHLVLRSGKKYAVLSEEAILQSLENKVPRPEYRYREMEKIGNNRLILYENNAVYLLINDKTMLLKAGIGVRVTGCEWGVLMEDEGMVSLIDSTGKFVFADFEQIRLEGNLAILKKNGLFGIGDHNGNIIRPIQFDSLEQVLGATMLAWKSGRRSLLLENGTEIPYPGSRLPEKLRLGNGRLEKQSWFILLTDSTNRKALYSRSGRQLLPFAYQQISVVEPSFFSIQAGGKFGLADSTGAIILKPAWSGISAINSENVCLAKGKTFSVFNLPAQKNLVNNLASVAKGYGNSRNMFIVRLADKAGIIDQSGKQLVPCIYEDLKYWNPTKCLVKRNGFWFGYLLSSGKEQIKAIQKFKLHSDKDNEQLYEIEADGKVGLESSLRGEITPIMHDEIIPFDLPSGTWFFMGSRVHQSSVFHLIYIDPQGRPIKTQFLTEEEYEGIVCK